MHYSKGEQEMLAYLCGHPYFQDTPTIYRMMNFDLNASTSGTFYFTEVAVS